MKPHPLYAIHGESDLGYGGYVVLTRAIGHDPSDRGGENFRRFAPLVPIARLNNGYAPDGTIPPPEHYEDFAQRCAHYVEMSPGCSKWIIGNEMNHRQEKPEGQDITPAMYAECFTLCRDEIKAVQYHSGDQVLVGAVAPWNVDTKYPGNESGDWARYFDDVQHELGVNGCDGFAIHTYARAQTPKAVVSADRMDPPFEMYHNGFRTYWDWMAAVLPRFQGLPVYITETNANGPWQDINTGFVRAMYDEIDGWNSRRPERPIYCLALYRWQYDQWHIDDKPQVHEDFYDAVNQGYTWPQTEPPEPPEDTMLLNPGLEPPYNRQGADEIEVADQWNHGYNQVDHPSTKRPEWKAETRDVGSGRVLEGDAAQKWFWTYGVGQAWIWQRIEGVEPGKFYELTAHVYVWSSGFDNPDESVNPGKMWCRLGVNPWGDSNANSLATEYGGAVVDNYDQWVKLSTVAQAKGGALSVFLWASPEHPAKHNDVYWDVVELKEWVCDGGTEPPVEPPEPGECRALTEGQIRDIVRDELIGRDPVVWPNE